MGFFVFQSHADRRGQLQDHSEAVRQDDQLVSDGAGLGGRGLESRGASGQVPRVLQLSPADHEHHRGQEELGGLVASRRQLQGDQLSNEGHRVDHKLESQFRVYNLFMLLLLLLLFLSLYIFIPIF
jgi:hypothetical protein